MATVTSDGREIVWCVFDNDGSECSDFLGAFDSEYAAHKFRDRMEEFHKRFYAEVLTKFEWSGSVEVTSVTLGEGKLPADAIHIMRRDVERGVGPSIEEPKEG